jgi:hypothetical protein
MFLAIPQELRKAVQLHLLWGLALDGSTAKVIRDRFHFSGEVLLNPKFLMISFESEANPLFLLV